MIPRLLSSKEGWFLILGWALVWMGLEKAFYGEAVFSYSSNTTGLWAYAVLLIVMVIASVAIPLLEKPFLHVKTGCWGIILAGALSSCALGACMLLLRDSEDPNRVGLVAAVIVYGISSCILFALWAVRLRDMVFDHGLPSVLIACLVGIALSFLLVPSSLRMSAYGQVVVQMSGFLSSIFLILLGNSTYKEHNEAFGNDAEASSTSREIVPESAGFHINPLALSVAMLTMLSFLIHLLGYSEYIGPGYVAIQAEDAYCFAALFAVIFILIIAALRMDSLSYAGDRLLLYLFTASVLFTFVVFFMMLSAVTVNTLFSYALTKLLRRIIKIVVFFMLASVVYQSNLSPIKAFCLALLLPTIAAKLTQILLSTFITFDTGTLVLYYSVTGFLLVLFLCLYFVFYIRGMLGFFAHETEDTQSEAVVQQDALNTNTDPHETALAHCVDKYKLTTRESDVMGFLAKGYSIQKISEKLFISENTVKTHIGSIYRKTGLHSRQEIIDLVSDAGTGKNKN
ncbi:MAG: hypothetical protein IKE43_06135 [Coriobacteriales bacterium]|nr:hypothetical protein [Coriobacteriales bacterium]